MPLDAWRTKLCRIHTLLAAWALVWTLSGCGGAAPQPRCAQQTCESGLRIELRQPRFRWQDGRYELTLRLDRRQATCSMSVSHGQVQHPRCDDRRVRWELDRDGAPRALHVLATPKRLQLRLQRDNSTLSSAQFSPQYQEVTPNGPGCEPTCQQGRELQWKLP